MGTDSSISWTDATRNVAFGCTRVDIDLRTGACDKCYIYRPGGLPRYGYDPNEVTLLSVENAVRDFRKWSKDPKIKKIFLNNYSDTFHESITFETIEIWHQRLIEAFPNFEFQLLTKRIGRAMMFYRTRPVPRNVWMGTTIGASDKLWRLNQLKKINAKIRWLSCEPLLSELVETTAPPFNLAGISWVVVGGECLTENTLIHTGRGPVKIIDILPSDSLLGYQGEVESSGSGYQMVQVIKPKLCRSTVGQLFYSGEKEVFRLKTNSRSIEASKDHRFLKLCKQPRTFHQTTRFDYSFEWTRLAELQENDLLLILRSNESPESISPYLNPIIRGFQDTNFALDRITRIESIGVKKTYDIATLNERHNFIANGIVVHNSDMKNPRPMNPKWAINISKACAAQNVSYYFKQRGGRGLNEAGGNLCPCCEKKHQEFPNCQEPTPMGV